MTQQTLANDIVVAVAAGGTGLAHNLDIINGLISTVSMTASAILAIVIIIKHLK